MVRGPQAERLTQAVTGGEPTAVNRAASEWEKCSTVLSVVGAYLGNAADTVKWAIGGETGPAVDAAFQKSAAAMTAKAEVLLKGHHALQDAGHAIQTAIDHEAKLEDMSTPTPYRAPGNNATDDELQKEATSKSKESAFASAFAAQEEKARAHADALDEALGRSSTTMKQIHGEPDPPPPPPPSTAPPGPAGGSSAGVGHLTTSTIGSGHAHAVSTGTVGDGPKHPTHGPQVDYVPTGGGHDDNGIGTIGSPGGGTGATGFPTTPIGGTEVGSTGSGSGIGVAGATAGGMAAGLIGAKLTGALKGGLFPSASGTAGTTGAAGRGTAASAVKGIGSSARTGGSGTLGRSAAAGAVGKSGASGSAGRSGAGATGRSGSGSGGRGSSGKAGAGGRSGAGGRGGAGGASGRAGRSKDDEKGKKHELFDVGEDWVDDEGAAPGVLD